MTNSLQTVLDRANKQTTPKTQVVSEKKQEIQKKKKIKKVTKARDKTVLIGGHFSPEVAKQLKILAAEEETTNQALLEEALNLLFIKKGKKAIKV